MPQQNRNPVRHTRAWLPLRNPMRHGRRISETGACGQLRRFLQVDAEDELDSDPQFCPFRVRALRGKKTGHIRITIADLKHSCPAFPHRWRGPTHKQLWLAETLGNRVVVNVKVPVKELLSGFAMDYRKHSNYKQMWRAKDKVRDWYLGGQRGSFHRIPALCQRLVEVDPLAIVSWCTQPDSSTFKRAFFCPSATRHSLPFLQPVVCLDACHTKNRKYPTQLFMATALDGESRVFILCFAIAPVENTDNWTWFLEQLHRSIHGIDDIRIPFISDRQKGLIVAMRSVFPAKVHGHCANHLRENAKTSFGKATAAYFISLVYINTKPQFDLMLADMKKSLGKGPQAVEWIESLDSRLWARHAFPLPRLGKVASNPAEQQNSGLLPIREYAPFSLCVELIYYMQGKFNTRRTEARKNRDMITERAMRRHNVNLRHYQQWEILDDGHQTAKIRSPSDPAAEFLVTLSPRLTCTCFELQEMLWPCEHVMAWDDRDGLDFRRHFHKCWKNSSLRALYAPAIPCFLTNDLDMSRGCFPPEIALKKGRHRVVRIQGGRTGQIRNFDEDGVHIDEDGHAFLTYPIEDLPNRLEPMPLPGPRDEVRRSDERREKRAQATISKRKCGICGRLGHNRRTCRASDQGPVSEGVGNNVVPDAQGQEVFTLTPAAPIVTQELTTSEHGAISISVASSIGISIPIDKPGEDCRGIPYYPPSSDDERERVYPAMGDWVATTAAPSGTPPDFEYFVSVAEEVDLELR